MQTPKTSTWCVDLSGWSDDHSPKSRGGLRYYVSKHVIDVFKLGKRRQKKKKKKSIYDIWRWHIIHRNIPNCQAWHLATHAHQIGQFSARYCIIWDRHCILFWSFILSVDRIASQFSLCCLMLLFISFNWEKDHIAPSSHIINMTAITTQVVQYDATTY